MNEIPRHSPHVFDNRKSVCVRENASACLTASNRPPDQTAKLFTEGVGRKGEPEGRGKPLIKTVQLSSHTSSTIKKVTALFFTSFQKVFRWKIFKGCVWTVKKPNKIAKQDLVLSRHVTFDKALYSRPHRTLYTINPAMPGVTTILSLHN